MTNPTNPMLEKAIAALEECAKPGATVTTEDITLAVLRAIREPDEGMIEAGAEEIDPDFGDATNAFVAYQAMLDHITGDNR